MNRRHFNLIQFDFESKVLWLIPLVPGVSSMGHTCGLHELISLSLAVSMDWFPFHLPSSTFHLANFDLIIDLHRLITALSFPITQIVQLDARLNAHNLQAAELVQRHSAHTGTGQLPAAVCRPTDFSWTNPGSEPCELQTKSNCQAANIGRSEQIAAEPVHQLCIVSVHAQPIRQVVAYQFVRLQFIAAQRAQKQIFIQPPIDQLFGDQSIPERLSRWSFWFIERLFILIVTRWFLTISS